MVASASRSCPLTQLEIIDEYFMEQRAKLLDIAAFLDRIERSCEHNAAMDFRLTSFRDAIRALGREEPARVERLLMLFSDPRLELLNERDQQNADGASRF